MQIISIINQKGGVGKSTTAKAIADGLSDKGFNVLSIDLDAQCNLTFTNAADNSPSILGVLTNEIEIDKAIQKTKKGDFIASNKALAGADAFIEGTGKEYRLKEALSPIIKKYDYIIIDTPPALGILTINALTVSTDVLIPAQADIYSLQGIEQLYSSIKAVKKYCNPELKIMGIVLTRYNARAILSKEVNVLAESLAKNINSKVFNTKIREAITIKEAQISQTSIFDYAPKSKVANDYNNLIEEILKEGEINGE